MLSKILSTATLIVVAWLSMQILHIDHALDSTQASFNSEFATVRAELGRVSEQTQSLNGEITGVRTELIGVSDQTQSLGDDVLARMDVLSAEQVKLAKSASNKIDPKLLKAKDREIARLKQIADLKTVYTTVLEADLMGYGKQGEKAAELLLTTKTAIWKASDKYPDKKDALRGLMATIDILAGRWKRGDFSSNAQKIQTVLKDVLSAQNQS